MPTLGDELLRAALLVAVVLWLWMLLHCVRRDPDRPTWLWMLLVFPVLGGVFYFLDRWLPLYSGAVAGGRGVRRRDIEQAEQDARNIGNPHQYLELGDLLWKRRQFARAAEAYRLALERDPEDIRAHYSVGRATLHEGKLDEARTHLSQVIAIDPQYRTGDAALAYGRVLIDLGEYDRAKVHLTADLRRRGDPEARLLLARAILEGGDIDEATSRLEALLDSLRAGRSPTSKRLAREARQLLRRAGAKPEAPSRTEGIARGTGQATAVFERRPFLTFAVVSVVVVGGDYLWRWPERSRRTRLAEAEKALAQSLGFDVAVLRLVKQATEHPIEQLVGHREDSDAPVPVRGIQSRIDRVPAITAVRTLRPRLAPLGYLVFWCELGVESNRLGVIRSRDPYDILRLKQTNGYNYGVAPKDVIARLREWDRQFGMGILGADYDWVLLELRRVPEDVAAFAEELHGFCPDSVEQGMGTLAALRQSIASTRQIFLWWD